MAARRSNVERNIDEFLPFEGQDAAPESEAREVDRILRPPRGSSIPLIPQVGPSEDFVLELPHPDENQRERDRLREALRRALGGESQALPERQDRTPSRNPIAQVRVKGERPVEDKIVDDANTVVMDDAEPVARTLIDRLLRR